MENTGMSQEHKDRLLCHLTVIVNRLESLPEIVEHLLENNHINRNQAEHVLSNGARCDRARSLILDVLLLRSEAAFYSFLKCLLYTQPDNHLYNALKDADNPSVCDSDIQNLFGIGCTYRGHLYQFHLRNLENLTNESPHFYDMTKYVEIGIHSAEYHAEERIGSREFSLIPAKGELVPLAIKDLFTTLPNKKENGDLRTVLLMGAPGSGKTMISLYLLQEIVKFRLFKQSFNLVFYMKFRELNKLKQSLTFQELVLNYCGPTVRAKEWDSISNILDKYESCTLYILDGYDEFNDHGYRKQFSSIQDKEEPKVLLHNLIYGKIRPKSKVLITTRPQCVYQLAGSYQRLVELNCLTDESQRLMVNKEIGEFPELQEAFLQHLEHNTDIRNLCSIPTHCKDLLEYAKWKYLIKGDVNVLPTTKSALLFMLKLKLLAKCDRKLEALLLAEELDCGEILVYKRKTLERYAKLARSALLASKVTQVFSREDLKKHGLTEEEMGNGILSSYLTCMADRFGDVKKTFFAFPHLIHQEHFCALDLLRELLCDESTGVKSKAEERVITENGSFQISDTEKDVLRMKPITELLFEMGQRDQPQELLLDSIPAMDDLIFDGNLYQKEKNDRTQMLAQVQNMQCDQVKSLGSVLLNNTGSMDMVTLLSLGTIGDPLCAELFQRVYPDTNQEVYVEKVVQLVRSVWNSQRKHHFAGDLFCIEALIESQQKGGLADELAPILSNPLNSLNLLDTIVSPTDCMKINAFLSMMSKSHFDAVIVKGQIQGEGLKGLLSAGASYDELVISTSRIGEAEWKILTEHLNTTSTLRKLTLSSNQSAIQNEKSLLQVQQNSSIKCLGLLHGQMDAKSLPQICVSLQPFKELEALDLTGNRLSSCCVNGISTLGALGSLPRLKYLTMNKCNLGHLDTTILADIVIHNKIQWLDMSHNEIGDSGVWGLSRCLSHPDTVLTGLGLVKCHIGHKGTQVLCRSMKLNNNLKILGFSKNKIDEGALDVSEMLENNTCLEELYLEHCGLNANQSNKVFTALKKHPRMKYLGLSYNEVVCKGFSGVVSDLLNTPNLQLQALCLSGCGLTDETMEVMEACLEKNEGVKLVNLGDNRSISAESVVSFVEQTKILHLGISKCCFGTDGLQKIGQAVVNSQTLVSCMVGDGLNEKGQELVGFLHQLCQYPVQGPLKVLWLYTSKPYLAREISKLESTFNGRVKVGVVNDVFAFYTASGVCCNSFPLDICYWFFRSHKNC